MEYIIAIIIGIGIGVIIGILVNKSKISAETAKSSMLAKENLRLKEDMEKRLQQYKAEAEAMLAKAKEEAREALADERNNSERLRRESDRQWEQKLEALRQ